MFEVGKKYKYRDSESIAECIFAGKQYAVLTLAGREMCVGSHAYCWKEFVEPRHEFFNAHRDRSSPGTWYHGPFTTRENADKSAMDFITRYGVLELIHHSDTKVESIFHLVKK